MPKRLSSRANDPLFVEIEDNYVVFLDDAGRPVAEDGATTKPVELDRALTAAKRTRSQLEKRLRSLNGWIRTVEYEKWHS